jgi:hypothetical protein
VPRLGFVLTTPPAGYEPEYAFVTGPSVQAFLLSAAFAAVRLRPRTFGTLHGRGGIGVPGGPCVVKVTTDCPQPTRTVAVPAARFVDVIAEAPPETVIPVTESPAGTFSVTVSVTPWFQKTRPVQEPTAIANVCVPPCEDGADTV